MAEVKKNKKNEKTVHISLPKVLPKKKIDVDGPVIHSPTRKSRSVESRSFSSEKKKRSGIAEYQQINLDKLDLSDKCSEQKRYASNSSLGSLSPNKRFSQIPIPSRFQLNNSRPISPVKTRSPSPILKKSPKASIKTKTIIVEPDLNIDKLSDRRPASPIKKIGFIKTSTPKPDCKQKPFFVSKVREEKHHEIRITPRSPKKKSSKTTLSSTRPISPIKKKITKATQNSRKVKTPKNKEKTKILPVPSPEPPEKIYNEKSSSFEDFNIPDSAGIDLFGELCPSKGSFFDLDDKKSETGMHIPLSIKSSSLSCRNSPSVIRTISGHELVFSDSFVLDGDDDGDEIAFSQLIEETEKKLDDKFSKLQVFHDDANEYDSEATTDSIPTYKKIKSDEARREKMDQARKNNSNLEVKNNKSWKNHEEELLNDVLYRQAMYHPAIVRQKNQEENAKLERGKSRSIEGGIEDVGQDGVARRKSASKNNFKKQSPTGWNKNSGVPNVRSWNEKNIELNCKEVCKELEKIQDVPKLVKEQKRERTRKERIAAALLRFAAKTIRLLVLFNLWPGGNIFFLTSNLLRSR